ncbi:MAG: alpha/beta hydrolase, partial [Candidatus Thorarchaeota archaeon]|nr:alpha/beta hydrolase [Candidatus Thorarchaeota archaeon]
VTRSYLQDVDSVVVQFNRPVLMGHSMGGSLTLLYALEKGERLRGIVLVSTGARLRVNPLIFDLLSSNPEAYVEALAEYMFAKGASSKLIEASQAEVRKCRPDVIMRDFTVCNEFDVMSRLNEISLPTLIVVGEEDLMTPVKYAKYMHDRIKGSELRIVSGAGHSVMLERPTEFNEIVGSWLSRVTET